MQNTAFSQMNLSDEIQRAVEELGYEEATDIQTAAIPFIMEGRDLIGHSQTGTGKTAAFGIPAVEKVDRKNRATQVLILCPTRELAVQACEEIRKYAQFTEGLRTVAVYGGQPIDRQLAALRQGAQIVVGTPGRVMDHMRRRTLRLDNLKMAILDEADEMLSMGFREDIETILQDTPEERQTLLFSATMSQEIMTITKKYLKNPEVVRMARRELTVTSIGQYYFEVSPGRKTEVLCRLIDVYEPRVSMVFCNTKRQVEELVSELQQRGYMADGLHGDMKQQQRDHVMELFRKSKINILVATDVAARGIDVDDVGAVFNFDIPQDIEYYVHRIGRTGRAGREGMAFTLVCGRRQLFDLRSIMNYAGCRIEQRAVPSLDQVREKRASRFRAQIAKIIKEADISRHRALLDSLLEEGYAADDVALALISQTMDIRRQAEEAEDLTLFRRDDGRRSPRRGERSRPLEGRRTSSVRSGARSSREENADMVRIRLDIGRQHHVSAGNILGAIAGETGLSGSAFGRIEINDNQSFVGVPREHADQVVERMKNVRIMGRKTTASRV